nr:immunoglobulin light chain junction region [Macaca mulatta]MOX48245.1 immunoglobulin light chain junction region [Macaca mulatta]MOX48368.1 immunoglobulin light chain junction region [Macaca mulatta]MOX48498.1 immunoglobulin light chain junction region [Macaca mulatta]MOX48770.1 immunoglobulin light chain junction region [Macaca mulatta]
CQQYSTTPYSF